MTSSDLNMPPATPGGIVTIGNFDGVHCGHQKMLATVCQIAKQQARRAVVVTFDPHPITVLKPEVDLPRLSTIRTRTKLLNQFGADEVVVLPVSTKLLSMSPEQFFAEVVRDHLQAAGIVEGQDFRFGKDRAGDTSRLQALCDQSGIGLTVIPPVCSGETVISSTKIRSLLAAGDVAAATRLLGHNYQITGEVSRGAGRGRKLGFPTANLTNIEVLLPADGVYAGVSQIDGGKHPVAISIGPNPTFDDNSRKVECHLCGYSGELYGRCVDIQLLARIRDLRSFESPDKLVAQIHNDVDECRTVFSLMT